MGKYGIENWERFNRSGVTPEDIRAMKIESVRDAFVATRKDFENLVAQLKDGIKEGRWTSILGDDVSGRHVARVIGGIASRYAKEHGKKPPSRLFFAGGGLWGDEIPKEEESQDGEIARGMHQEKEANIRKYIEEQSERLGERTLFVTEHIINGGTARKIRSALEERGIQCDVATLWASGNSSNEDVYIGKSNAGLSGFFGSNVSNVLYELGVPTNEATGVKKRGTGATTARNKSADMELVKIAKEEANKLTDELYEKYFSEE